MAVLNSAQEATPITSGGDEIEAFPVVRLWGPCSLYHIMLADKYSLLGKLRSV